MAESLSYVLSTLEGSSDTFGHYFLILYILQPFGISRIKGSVFGVVAGSALIAAGASGVFTYLLPALFPAYYKEQNWTLGKHVLNLLLMLLLIAVGIWAYQSWLMGMWLDKRLFFLALSWVMVLAPFLPYFSDVEPQFATDPQSERSYGDERSPFKENIPGSWDSELGRQGVFLGRSVGVCRWHQRNAGSKGRRFPLCRGKGELRKVGYRSDSDKEKKITWRLLRATMKQAEEAVSACPLLSVAIGPFL